MKKPWKTSTSAGGSARPGNPQQSIRGRISGPYPIQTPMDDEFPMRHPGTGIATPVDADFKASKTETTLPPTDQPHRAAPAPPAGPLVGSSPRRDNLQSSRTAPATRSLGSAPTPARRLQRHHQPTARYSMVSAADTTHSKGSKDRPQRKKSTLRGAIGKIFNRRRKPSSNGSPNNTDSEGDLVQGSLKQQRSSTIQEHQTPDPGLVERQRSNFRSRPYPGAESKRSASLPITEFDRALRSHSIGPEDVLAIESARNSLSADFGQARKRAAALRARDSDFVGLSPRPASSHGRDGKGTSSGDDPSEIGRAITSDFTGLRRRSRSLSGLIEVDDDQAEPRRRSDEIRYWRESYDPAFRSPVSSNVQEGGDLEIEAAKTTDEAQGEPPQTPPEPFSFNNFVSVADMSGMKITEAAGMETRIGELEGRVRRLEQVLTQLCHAHPDFRPHIDQADRSAPPVPVRRPSTSYTSTGHPRQAPVYRPSTHDMSSSIRPTSSRRSEVSHMSFGEAPTFVGSVHRSAVHPTHRPTSTATIRGATSLPQLPKEPAGPFTMDHYATLLGLIHTERSAREALEAQVKRLGYQVSAMARTSAMAHDRVYEPPPTAKSFGDVSAFDHDDDVEQSGSKTKLESQRTYYEEPESATSEYSEPFATPGEGVHSFGAFGEKLEEDNKRTARTLSLSQLTISRKPQTPSPKLPQPQE